MDQSWTETVINSMGPNTTPRARQIFSSLIQHVHDFTRENRITEKEWQIGLDFINAIGQKSDDKQDEAILVLDILGMES